MKIESHDTDLESLLTSNFFFIPTFQRPYSWDDDNIEEFWQDVSNTDDDDYFIGSMVVYKSGRQQFGVVDGQQRLTTITVLLSVIRDAFIKLGGDDLAQGLHQLIERTDRDNNLTFVLRTETSYPYFQDVIQNLSEPNLSHEPLAEEQRLAAAYSIFKEKVDSVLYSIDLDPTVSTDSKSEIKIRRLTELRDDFLFLKLILVELDNEDDAYIIFETLNTRGKDLALSDLLKNHFTKNVRSQGDVDLVREQWAKLLGELYNSEADLDPDTFLTHSWSSRFEATTQQKAFKKIRTAIKKTNAKKHLADFVEDSKYYRSIFERGYGWGKSESKVAKSLQALQMFKVTQQTPAVLSLVRAYHRGLIKSGRLASAVQAIENFHFLFTAVTSSRSSGGISAMYSSFGRKLFDSKDSNEAGMHIQNLIEKLREKRPSPSEFSASFGEISYTSANSKQGALVRYILEKLSKSAQLKFSDDYAELTVEHIHPQSAVDEVWTDQKIGQLGNLIFLTQVQNQELDNGSFEEKVTKYAIWRESVPEYVRSQTEWTPELVEQRTSIIATDCYDNIWRI